MFVGVVVVRHPAEGEGRPSREEAPLDPRSAATYGSAIVTDASPLRRLLEETAATEGLPMKALTVLAAQNDPFRVDTPAGHRDGAWLAITARELGLGNRKIHLRGLHYMVIGRPKPDGRPYTNTDADWLWLSATAGKAARWLGYLPFDQITDQRNAAPVVRIFEPTQPRGYLSAGAYVDVPDVDELAPTVGIDGFKGTQPYKLVLFGEKSSLADVLGPVAVHFEADLYLPTGEISDTLMYQMARIGAEDGRPMVVMCFSDADPAGWQMPVSISRKLQGFKAGLFPDLEFCVYRAALRPEQVGQYGLPSTPLKDTEKRGDAWRAAMGVEQTEIDALASLQPQLLRRIAHNALGSFYDGTLDRRVLAARSRWLEQAQAALEEQMDADHLARIRADAEERLSAVRAELDALNDAMRIEITGFRLPEAVVPTAELDGHQTALELLIDSSWPFSEQCRRLLDSKNYRHQGGDA